MKSLGFENVTTYINSGNVVFDSPQKSTAELVELCEDAGEKTDKQEQKDGKKSYIVRESNASFVRWVVLPEGADADNISAELDKGLLKVTIPIHRPEAKRIQIKASNSKGKAKLASLTNAKSETK